MNSSRNLQEMSKMSKDIIDRYGSFTDFARTFCFKNQKKFCAAATRCICGHAPSFSRIDMVYGKGAASACIYPQLVDLGEFCGCKDKMGVTQCKQLSQVIVSNFSFLKITEFMLFLWWFKSGKYGRFYGSVDPLVISSALRDFLQDRYSIIESEKTRHSEKERAQSRENAISYEQWLAMKGDRPEDHPVLTMLFMSKGQNGGEAKK